MGSRKYCVRILINCWKFFVIYIIGQENSTRAMVKATGSQISL